MATGAAAMSDRIELCRHRYDAGGLCLGVETAERHHTPRLSWVLPEFHHDYEAAVLVPRPLDLEAAEALLVQFVETVLEEGEMPRSEAMWNRTLDIAAALGVTE
jgi:hypothetical protein